MLPAFLALLVATGLWLGTSAPLLAGASTLSTVRINAGGDAVAPFAADQYYSGGTTLHSTNVVSTAGVSNPAPEAVYQQYRYASNLTYTVPGFPSGSNAAVRLHFAETWWTGSGQRVFSVRLNGQWVLTNFDIWQVAGGSNKAVVEDFNTTVGTDGNVEVLMMASKDNAMLNGLEIADTAVSPSPISSPTPTPTPPSSPTPPAKTPAPPPAPTPPGPSPTPTQSVVATPTPIPSDSSVPSPPAPPAPPSIGDGSSTGSADGSNNPSGESSAPPSVPGPPDVLGLPPPPDLPSPPAQNLASPSPSSSPTSSPSPDGGVLGGVATAAGGDQPGSSDQGPPGTNPTSSSPPASRNWMLTLLLGLLALTVALLIAGNRQRARWAGARSGDRREAPEPTSTLDIWHWDNQTGPRAVGGNGGVRVSITGRWADLLSKLQRPAADNPPRNLNQDLPPTPRRW